MTHSSLSAGTWRKHRALHWTHLSWNQPPTFSCTCFLLTCLLGCKTPNAMYYKHICCKQMIRKKSRAKINVVPHFCFYKNSLFECDYNSTANASDMKTCQICKLCFVLFFCFSFSEGNTPLIGVCQLINLLIGQDSERNTIIVKSILLHYSFITQRQSMRTAQSHL